MTENFKGYFTPFAVKVPGLLYHYDFGGNCFSHLNLWLMGPGPFPLRENTVRDRDKIHRIVVQEPCAIYLLNRLKMVGKRNFEGSQ